MLTSTGHSKAFVNFDADFIMSEAIELVDPSILVIEILENVKVNQVLIERLEQLKKKGFMIALDDFELNDNTIHLLNLADIIKWDILATPLGTLDELVSEALKYNKIILAEKVETEEQFLEAKAMGFHLFQGFFFSEPKIVGYAGKQDSFKSHYSLILEELSQEEPSFTSIAKIIETDVKLCYRLVRVSSYQRDEEMISSITKALIRMGMKQLERWISVLMLQDLAANKPLELMKISLIRSKFAEYIAENSSFKKRKEEFFITGLFSLLDVILDSTMEDALAGIAISEDIINALIYNQGSFMPVGHLIFNYELADWDKVEEFASLVGIDEAILSQGYLEAISWTTMVFNSLY
jgi:EAL and modified HD-GYP domain-containing signal transduction protein